MLQCLLVNFSISIFFFLWRNDPTRVMASSFLMFLDHTQRRTTVGRTSLDEWSARPRDFSLTTHNTYNRQISMPQVGFEPTISAGERPQIYALDRAATGTVSPKRYNSLIIFHFTCGATTLLGLKPPHCWGFEITHTGTPQSVGLLWTRDLLEADRSTWQRTIFTRDRHPWPRRYSTP